MRRWPTTTRIGKRWTQNSLLRKRRRRGWSRNGSQRSVRGHPAEESTMAATIDIGSLITRTPGIVGGRPRIAGTGVSVRRIAIWYKLGHTPEEITMHIPHLSLAQVHAALAYYH